MSEKVLLNSSALGLPEIESKHLQKEYSSSFNSILETIGGTPLVQLKKISSGSVYAKAEFLNPGGSIKDRVAKHILESAQNMEMLRPGMVIIESTSGNTGIGLALVGVQMGYRVICVMPENMSEERKKIIQARFINLFNEF